MISERTLYVGLMHSPDAQAIPAGILRVRRNGVLESGEFAYGRRYLQLPEARALNPDHLPLQTAPFVLPERRLRDGGALPLTFRDALPDTWGRKVLEAQHGKPLHDLDALLMTNADRVGAMVFSEALPLVANHAPTELTELEDLAEAVRRLEFDMDISPKMKRLLQRGGTLGGARPKATFVHEKQLWIAKFPSQGDDHDVELVEAATLALARQCGIHTAEFFLRPLKNGQALLLRRFDREGNIGQEQVRHYLSVAALLNTPYESSGGSYVEFARALRRISSHPEVDLSELYRRMVFNIAVDNSDDHVKNHGVLMMPDGRYRLAPAFDMVIQLSNVGYQQLPVLAGDFASNLGLARQAAPHFGIRASTADTIIDSVLTTVHASHQQTLASHGATKQLMQRVAACLKKQAKIIA